MAILHRLKAECEYQGLSTKGTKSELIQRLKNHKAKQNETIEPTKSADAIKIAKRFEDQQKVASTRSNLPNASKRDTTLTTSDFSDNAFLGNSNGLSLFERLESIESRLSLLESSISALKLDLFRRGPF